MYVLTDRDEKSLLMMCGAELYEINVKKSKEADHDYFCDITFYAFVFNLETITFDETDKSYFGGFYEKDGSMYLAYYTRFKEPFEHLLIGYLQTVAEKTYNVGVNITLLKSTDGKFGVNTHHAALGITGNASYCMKYRCTVYLKEIF